MVYRSEPAAVMALDDLARVAAHLPALSYHYDRLARGAWSAGEADIRLKSYFYALRPALALLWLRDRGTAPPMDLPALLAGLPLPKAVEEAIQALLPRKATAAEADTISRHPTLERFLADGLAQPAARPAAWDREPTRITADTLFKTFVLPG